MNTGGKCFKVWESYNDSGRPDIHEVPLADVTVMTPMLKYGDVPTVVIDLKPFDKWLKSRQPKEVPWIIPEPEPKCQPKPAGSTSSPAHHEDGTSDSDNDSGHSSPASSQPASPACSVGSMVEELVVSSSSRSDSGSDTLALPRDLSDNEKDQALTMRETVPLVAEGETTTTGTEVMDRKARSIKPALGVVRATMNQMTAPLAQMMMIQVTMAGLLWMQHYI